MESQTTHYRYLDYYSKTWRKVRCQVVQVHDRTVTIRLLAFGPNGRQPGSLMRVHKKSINWKEVLDTTDLSWHA